MTSLKRTRGWSEEERRLSIKRTCGSSMRYPSAVTNDSIKTMQPAPQKNCQSLLKSFLVKCVGAASRFPANELSELLYLLIVSMKWRNTIYFMKPTTIYGEYQRDTGKPSISSFSCYLFLVTVLSNGDRRHACTLWGPALQSERVMAAFAWKLLGRLISRIAKGCRRHVESKKDHKMVT